MNCIGASKKFTLKSNTQLFFQLASLDLKLSKRTPTFSQMYSPITENSTLNEECVSFIMDPYKPKGQVLGPCHIWSPPVAIESLI
jgi:hypothetical protein